DSAISFAGAVTGSFALTLDAGSGAVSFDGAVGTEESPLGAVVCAGSGSYTFSGAVYASTFSLTASGAQVTLLEDDTFGTLSLTGAGSTVRFGAGKTQTVTTALISTGAAGSPVTLTTAASAPSASDTETWWLLDIPQAVGAALGESDVSFTQIEYSKSVSDITHEWAESVTEKTAGSTLNWFLRKYFWRGGQSSDWATAANWALSEDGTVASLLAPSYDGTEKIIIATAPGGNTLVLAQPVTVSSLLVQSGKTIDLAGYSLTALSITNEGTVRLTGGSASSSQTISGAVVNGADSTVCYYGTSLSSLPWDGDSTLAGCQYENLVFEESASGSVESDIAVSGNLAVQTDSALGFTGTITFTGSGVASGTTQTVEVSRNESMYFGSVIVASGSAVSTASDFTVNGSWTVESGASFTVSESGGRSPEIRFTGAGSVFRGGGMYYPRLVFAGSGAEIADENSFGDVFFTADTTLSSSNTFLRFSCEKAGVTLTFAAGTTQTISEMFTAGGTGDSYVTLKSSVSGSVWRLAVGTAATIGDLCNVFYVSVSDSESVYESITAFSSVDGGNNTNWIFDDGLALPNLALMLSPVGETQVYGIFAGKLFYRGVSFGELDAQTLQTALEMIPQNVQLTRNGAVDAALKVDSAEYVPSGDGSAWSVLLFTLSQPVTFDDICNVTVYIRRISSEEKHHYHPLSDFALNVVEPLYALTSLAADAGSASASLTETVHDFTASSADTLLADADILLQADLQDDLQAVLIPDRKAAIQPQWQSATVNQALGTSWRVWLPWQHQSLSGGYNSNTLTGHEGEAVSGKAGLWNYTFQNEERDDDSCGWTGGEEIQFLFSLRDSSGSDIMIDFDGDGSREMPLYALSFGGVSASSLPELDLWSFKIKGVRKQRGGVTILNNVINVLSGEETVLQVNMRGEGLLSVYVLSADGSIVRRLEHGRVDSGTHSYRWDGTNSRGDPVARGMYFIRITGDGIDETRKVLCVKE
ncbi:MAG: hypothetical protein K6G80_04430, partial [Treponema sp.]|nr:hypothetical protein [Treponema sp.]